jgi:hypothetical protein
MLRRMRLSIAFCILAAPVLAQDLPEAPETPAPGFSLIEEGAKLIIRGMMSEMEPAIAEMGKALEDLEPAMGELGVRFKELVAMIDDFRNYSGPEMLPNGDIIFRRTAPLPPKLPVPHPPQGEIDL